MRCIAVNLHYICHSDSREKTLPMPRLYVSCQEQNNHISLFSALLPPPPSLSSSLQSLCLNDPFSAQFSLFLTPSAKVPLSAMVILINYHCRHVPVPASPRWQASVKPPCSCRECRASLEKRGGQRSLPPISAAKLNFI